MSRKGEVRLDACREEPGADQRSARSFSFRLKEFGSLTSAKMRTEGGVFYVHNYILKSRWEGCDAEGQQ